MRWFGSASRVEWGPPPPAVPLRLLVAAALLVGVAVAWYCYAAIWTPLQRYYLGAYVRSAVALTPSGAYTVGRVRAPKTSRLVTDDDLVTVTSASGESTLALSAAAIHAGVTSLMWSVESHPSRGMHALLQVWIYRDQSLLALAAPAWSATLTLFLGALFGTRVQAALEKRARRVQAPTWRPPAPPVTLEYGYRTPPSTTPATIRTLHQGAVASPVLPAPLASAPSAGPTATAPEAPTTPTTSWPHPLLR
jgi:hypothetical protein